MWRGILVVTMVTWLLTALGQAQVPGMPPAYHTYDEYRTLIEWQGASDAETADADADGATNLEEYAHGTSPVDSSDLPELVGSVVYVDDSAFFDVSYRRNPVAADVTYQLQASADRISWQDVVVPSEDVTISSIDSSYLEQIVERVAIGAEKQRFFRISISRSSLSGSTSFSTETFASSLAGSGIGLRIIANPGTGYINPDSIEATLEPYKGASLHVEFVGRFRLGNDLQFANFDTLYLTGTPTTYLEQGSAYNSAASIHLIDSQNVFISDIGMGGSGEPRPDDAAPQQNGIHIVGSSNVTIERCFIGPLKATMHHGVHIAASDEVLIDQCRFQNITAASVLSGTGIWPHPTDLNDFVDPVDLRSSGITVQNCEFENVSVAIGFDDATYDATAQNNSIVTHYSHAIIAEDGATDILVDNNQTRDGRGALAVVGTGQTMVTASFMTISNNIAINANDSSLVPPQHYISVTPVSSAYHNTENPNITLINNQEQD